MITTIHAYTASQSIDVPSTRVIMNRAVKMLVWYDNEY